MVEESPRRLGNLARDQLILRLGELLVGKSGYHQLSTAPNHKTPPLPASPEANGGVAPGLDDA